MTTNAAIAVAVAVIIAIAGSEIARPKPKPKTGVAGIMAIRSINSNMPRGTVIGGMVVNDIFDTGRTFQNPCIARYDGRKLTIHKASVSIIAAAIRIIGGRVIIKINIDDGTALQGLSIYRHAAIRRPQL
jgi:hypothetical protein